ncbi:MAG: hypothetical protein MdMp014T_0827 [Treponematales bacterium]
MAVQPIDLQTLFTQVDKVGKDQSAQREGAQIQASLQEIETQRKIEEQVRSVNEARDAGDGAESVHNNGGNNSPGEGGSPNGKEKTEQEEQQERYTIRDPALGKNIDFSG